MHSLLLCFFLFPVYLFAERPDTLSNKKDTLCFKISEVQILGNKKTKHYIIEREISFKAGEVICNSETIDKKIHQSKNNLINTGLFSFATVTYIPDSSNSTLKVVVLLNERWYLWPFPIVELADRNFNAWWETRDFSRVNYGMYLVKANVGGRRQTLILRAKYGFTQQYGATYNIPNLGEMQRSGFSFSVNYLENNQIIIKTYDNKIRFFKNDLAKMRREFNSSITYNFRLGFYSYQSVTFKYTNISVADTVLKINPEYLSEKPADKINFFTVNYNIRYDKRNYRAYPLTGYYLEADLVLNGLEILKNELQSFRYSTLTAKKYFKLNERYYCALSAKAKWSSNNFQPYYFVRGLGYTDFVRGYEYYNFDGQAYLLAKSTFKYCIIQPRPLYMASYLSPTYSNLKFGIYINAFFDAGKVADRQTLIYNPKSAAWLYGYGLGLDFVFTNDIVMRTELTNNRYNLPGFYLHFSAPL